MPGKKQHLSALKCIRSDARKRVYRGKVRTGTRTSVKKARVLLGSRKAQGATTAVQDAIRALDKAVAKGVIHKNNAARRKSRLMAALSKSQAAV